METISLDTTAHEQLLDITAAVQRIVGGHPARDGICHLWCMHTTAGLTINENADPDVKSDLLLALAKIVDARWPYRHAEGNSPAHVKSSLVGCQLAIPVRGGRLALGSWQGVLFCEFDGPRRGRQVLVSVLHSGE